MRFAPQTTLPPMPALFWRECRVGTAHRNGEAGSHRNPPPLPGNRLCANVAGSRGPLCHKPFQKDSGVVNTVNLIILLVILILPMLLTFWAIRDVAYGQFPTLQTKYIWLVVVTLLPVVGALVYLVAGRSQRRQMPTS